MCMCWSFCGLKVLRLDLEHPTIQSIHLATENVIKQLLHKLREFAGIWGILTNQISSLWLLYCNKRVWLSMQKWTFAQKVQSKYTKQNIYTQTENGGWSKCSESSLLTMLWLLGTVINKRRAYFPEYPPERIKEQHVCCSGYSDRSECNFWMHPPSVFMLGTIHG